MFRILVFAALLAGAGAGLLLTGVQQWQVTPLILAAEELETAAAAHEHESGHAHEHGEEAWAPADGSERILFTLLANVLSGIGYGLLLVAGMAARGHGGWRRGLLWGLAGYAVFFLAPSLGLHPELPGTVSAPLAERQIWWIATVLSSAAGLGLLFFAKLPWRGVAVLLLLAPHLFGAPLPQAPASLAPAELEHAFIVAAALSNGVFWISLGVLGGLFLQHFLSPDLPSGRLASS